MSIRSRVSAWCFRAVAAIQKSGVVAEYEGIKISDIRGRSAYFKLTIIAALRMIKNTDPRRFARVRKHIRFVANCVMDHPGAEYLHEHRMCRIDFEEPSVSGCEPHFHDSTPKA